MKAINFQYIKDLLDSKVVQYNNCDFIASDPICIPHSFSKRQDIEIMGFFASIFAWGQRITIINKCKDLALLMDNSPYQFITQHQETDLKALLKFKHRTFNDTDLLYCIHFFKQHYAKHKSLESAFFPRKSMSAEEGLIHFHNYFFSDLDAPLRTKKHIPTPTRKSACKRLNMYLRWMVRKDNMGVDFGLWNSIKPKDLICPLDLHVERTAKMLGILSREKPDWAAAMELTTNLREFDANDPVKYDFALFGISIEEKCIIDIRQ